MNHKHLSPTFAQIKRRYLNSGVEIRRMSRKQLESLSLSSQYDAKRHHSSSIMGLLLTDLDLIGLASDLSHKDSEDTLLHELIHLYDETIPEAEVEAFTISLSESLSASDRGFLRFLAS